MIDWRFVVHTHPYTINALTCAPRRGGGGARALRRGGALGAVHRSRLTRLAKLMQEKLDAYRAAHRGDPADRADAEPRAAGGRGHHRGDHDAHRRRGEKDHRPLRAPVPREDRPVPEAAVRIVPAPAHAALRAGRAPKVAAVRNSALVEHFLHAENRAGREPARSCRTTSSTASRRPWSSRTGDEPEKLLSGFPAQPWPHTASDGATHPKILLIDGIGRGGRGGHQAVRGDVPRCLRRPT